MSEIVHGLPQEDLAEQVEVAEAENPGIMFALDEADLTPSPGHPGFLRALDEMRALHIKKSADYGTGADPLANCRASAELGVKPWVAVLIRAGDKWQRIKSFLANGRLENESIRDSFRDMAAYLLIADVLFGEENPSS